MMTIRLSVPVGSYSRGGRALQMSSHFFARAVLAAREDACAIERERDRVDQTCTSSLESLNNLTCNRVPKRFLCPQHVKRTFG